MKRTLTILLSLCLLFSLTACTDSARTSPAPSAAPAPSPASSTAAATPAPATDAEPIVLKFGTHLTDNHCLTTAAVKPWMDRVTQLTNNQVAFEYYGNSQMGKATDALNLVTSGVLDCSYTLYMLDDLPVMDLPMLPNLYEDCEYATYAYWDILNQEPFAGMLADAGVKPIMCVMWEPYTIATVKSQPQTLADFSRLKLRSSGGLHDQAAAALGITPVSISASETLEALNKNTVDGCWGSTTSWTDYQYTQILKYGITNAPLNGWGGIFTMSKSKFDSLPANVQAAINQACEEMSVELGSSLKQICADGWTNAEKAGVQLYEIDEAVATEIRQKLEPISQQWLAEQDKAGYPATELYNQFKAAYETHAK